MLIHGSPITVDFPPDLGLKDRFWYWRGASGKKYIHSIYPAHCCPPLPGAIYVAVKCTGALRTAVAVGKFPPFWDGTLAGAGHASFADLEVSEIHVHLLAKEPEIVRAVLEDLHNAFDELMDDHDVSTGFHEDTNPALASSSMR